MNNYKPAGYTSLAPYLIVNGAPKTMEFLTKVFGATELRRMLRPDGTVMHAEVRIDDTVLMLADGTDGWPPSKKEDEDKRGGIKDAGGTTWWIATKVV